MQTIKLTNTVDNKELSGLVFDAPKKPKAAIALIHGFGEHGGRYEPMAAALKKKNIATVSGDLHGHTEGKRGVCHSYNVLMSDVDAVIEKTKSIYPGVPLFFFGHSMGGGLVLNNVLRRRPEGLAGVISSAPLIKPTDPFPGIQRFILRVIRKIMPNFAADAGLDSAGISTLQAEVDKYNNDPLVHGKMGAGLAVDVMAGGEWLLDYANVWYETVPLLLYHAKDDPLTDFKASEKFASLAPGCEFHAYDNVLHEMHNDTSRGEVFAMIDTFITKHMTLTVYHLKTCDTCRKAIKALKAAGHELTLIDVRADGVPGVDLKRIANSVGWEALLNTRSTTWRGLSEAEKSDMDEAKALKLMAKHPTLIKRPVIDTGTNITVGWTKPVQDMFCK